MQFIFITLRFNFTCSTPVSCLLFLWHLLSLFIAITTQTISTSNNRRKEFQFLKYSNLLHRGHKEYMNANIYLYPYHISLFIHPSCIFNRYFHHTYLYLYVGLQSYKFLRKFIVFLGKVMFKILNDFYQRNGLDISESSFAKDNVWSLAWRLLMNIICSIVPKSHFS